VARGRDSRQEALAAVGANPYDLIYQEVTTAELADALVFRGSPSILIDGVDPFAQPDDPVWLSCWLYYTGEGLQPAPTAAQLEAALTGRRKPATRSSSALAIARCRRRRRSPLGGRRTESHRRTVLAGALTVPLGRWMIARGIRPPSRRVSVAERHSLVGEQNGVFSWLA
jgi:hypothetical protein